MKKYQNVELKVLYLAVDDVITSSIGNDTGDDPYTEAVFKTNE